MRGVRRTEGITEKVGLLGHVHEVLQFNFIFERFQSFALNAAEM